MKARIVTLDIETAPLTSYHWGLFDETIGVEQIQQEWSILSYSAKWLGSDRVEFRHTGGRGVARVRDDKSLLGHLWKLLDEADIVIAQNGKQFDLRKINARLAMHAIGPYSPIRVIDTCLAAKRFFGFTSNKLAWLSKHLTDTPKSTHGAFPGFQMWTECLRDNPKAWAAMRAYNKQDVIATEKLYLRLRPWIENHPNVATYFAGTKPVCPKCGSHKLISNGFRTNQTGLYRRLQCQGCGGWAFERPNRASKAARRALLGN